MRNAMPGQLVTKVAEHEVSTLPTWAAHDRRVARTVIFLRGGGMIDVDSDLSQGEEHQRVVEWLEREQDRDATRGPRRVVFRDDAEPTLWFPEDDE